MMKKFEKLMETIINALPVATDVGAEFGVYPNTKQWAQGFKERAIEAIEDGEDVETFIAEWTEYAKKNNISLEKKQKPTELDLARKKAKEELGRDFDRVCILWQKLNYLSHFSIKDYEEMTTKWKNISGIIHLSGKELERYDIRELAERFADVYSPQEDVSSWTEEECSEYVTDTLEHIKTTVFSDTITKEQYPLVKISIEDIIYNANINAFVFDNNRLYNPLITEAVPTNGIPLLETSEDGISRALKEKGVDTISVFMGVPEYTLELNKGLEKGEKEIHKHRLIAEGFYTLENKHYMPAFQSPSANRQATITFVLVTGKTIEECHKQIQDMWLEVTGFSTWQELLDEFCDENGEVVIAKFIARIATRGSNSFSLDKVSPEISKIIKGFNVCYTKDTKTAVHKIYKTKLDNGLSDIMEKDVKIVDGDGQGLISFIGSAYVATGLKVISRNDLEYFLEEFEKIGKDASKVKIGTRLDKIIKRIPAVFQIRHGEKKGLLVRWNLEAIDATKDINVIIPDSVRKFIGGEWSDYPLEICNYLKKKDEWVHLNPQFIGAFSGANPDVPLKICRYWEKYILESIHNIAKRQQFHNLAKSNDEDDKENSTISSYLVSALRTSSDLIDDFQINNWSKSQYERVLDDMKIGRLMVKGQYTYMVFDPAYQLNKWFNLDLPCLASGEFYHNGKDCKAMLARSPLIAPSEAQKVQLVSNNNYRYLENTVVFNGFDGTADIMGGGDFDGDLCEIVCDDTELGKIVVDSIKEYDHQIWSEPKSAKTVPLTWDNIIEYWATNGSTQDRTGVITNYATRALDIARHLISCIFFAQLSGCEDITFVHPKAFGKGLGCNTKPYVRIDNGKRTWVVKGLAECKLTRKAKDSGKYDKDFKPEDVEPWDVWFPCDFGKDNTAVLGRKSFEEVAEIIEYFFRINGILRCDQGDEIDGAKTGFIPEILECCKIVITASHMLSRQEVLDRDQAIASKLNVYQSLSPLGRIHDYSVMVANKVKEAFDTKGSNKIFLLQSLLTEEETRMLNMNVIVKGKTCSLIEYIKDYRKKPYNQKLHNAINNGLDIKASIKEKEIYGTLLSDGTRAKDGLYSTAEDLGITPEVMAVACYIATYTKDSKQSEGLTYGWLLFDELLSVFSRGNKKFELFKLPSFVESVYIKDRFLYVNDSKYTSVKAEDCGIVPIQIINGRPYALIHKISDNVVKQRKPNVVFGSKTYTIGVYGFKYHIGTKADWKKAVIENGFVFDITMDDTNRAVISINGKSISALMPVGADFDLMNKKVKVVNDKQTNPIKENDASITNLQVVIIGEAN